MKKTTQFALSGLAAGIAFAAFTTTAQAQEEWTMTSTWPENLDLIKIDQHWVELVNKLAGEELQINFRAGGTLMPGTEVFDATSGAVASYTKRSTGSSTWCICPTALPIMNQALWAAPRSKASPI